MEKRINRSFDITAEIPPANKGKTKLSGQRVTSKKVFRNFADIVDSKPPKKRKTQNHNSILVSAKHSSKNEDAVRNVMNKSAHGFADLSERIGDGLEEDQNLALATADSRPPEKVQTSVVITTRENEDSDEPVSDQVRKMNNSEYHHEN